MLYVYPDAYAKRNGLFEFDRVEGGEFSRATEIFGFKGVKLESPNNVGRTLGEALASVRDGKSTIVHVRALHP